MFTRVQLFQLSAPANFYTCIIFGCIFMNRFLIFRIIAIGKNILIFHCLILMFSGLIKPTDSKFITSVLVFCATLCQYRFLAIHLLRCIHTTLHNVTCFANSFWIYWHFFKYCTHQATLAALYNWYAALETNEYWSVLRLVWKTSLL